MSIILYFWQFPQNLLGLLMVLFTRAKKSEWEGMTYYDGRIRGAVSLGRYIIIDRRCCNDARTIQITCSTPGADIHYTLDSSDPTKKSAQYTTGKQWHVPSRSEILILYDNKTAIGNFSTKIPGYIYYWASSEHTLDVSDLACKAWFDTGGLTDERKNYTMSRVRCVRFV